MNHHDPNWRRARRIAFPHQLGWSSNFSWCFIKSVFAAQFLHVCYLKKQKKHVYWDWAPNCAHFLYKSERGRGVRKREIFFRKLRCPWGTSGLPKLRAVSSLKLKCNNKEIPTKQNEVLIEGTTTNPYHGLILYGEFQKIWVPTTGFPNQSWMILGIPPFQPIAGNLLI